MVSSIVLGAIFGDAIMAAAALGSVGYAAAAFAINFAVSQIIVRTFADNPETQQDMGVRQQVPPSAVNAIPIVYGDAYMGGTFVDAVLANEQRKMYYVLAISSISPNGQFTYDLDNMYYGDRLIAFDPAEQGKVASLSDGVNPPDTKIAGNLYIYLFTSSQSGVITPINSNGSLPHQIMGGTDIPIVDQRWPSTGRQMNGLAFAIVVMNYNRDADTTSLSPITFHVSHTLNGTGVAKAGDVWYDYITNPVYGGAVNTSFVNASSATTLNTYGDELITFTDSDGNPATQARYRINGVLDAGQSVLSNIDRIMSACDSWMTYNAALGQWSVVINKAESTSYAFDDDNIVGEIRVSATDITSSINQVEARFPFKDNRDQAAFVNIETPSGLLYPNEPVNKYSITYDLVNDSVQTHYLANRLLEQAREDLIVSFSTTYYGIQVDAGQVVSVTNSDYGWNAKLFRVMKVNEASLPNGMLGARLELSEYNATVYDNADITQFAPVANSQLSSPSYFSSLAAPTVVGYPSATFAHFDVTVFVPVTGRVSWGNLYYTTSATPTSGDWKWLATAGSPNATPVPNNIYYTFTNQVLGAGTYYFAYNVGNDIGQSTLSPKSTAFVWSPVANSGPFVDISGFTGFTKNSAGTVITPSSSILTAVTQNVTSPTYAWVITGATPTSGADSTITITPSLTASSVTASLTVNGSNLTTPIVRTITMPIALDGSGGSAGLNSATVNLYNKNTSTTPPALFSGTFTYTFTSGVLSGGTLNGWSQTPPSIAAGEFLFISLATASATTATDTIPYTEFSTPQVISGTGTNGANTAIVSLFNSNTSAVTPPTSFSGTFVYLFETATLSGGTLNGWSQTAPTLTSGQYLWQRQATAFSIDTTDTIEASEFSDAVVVGGVGTAGNSFRIAYYTQSQSLSAPSVSPNPTTGSTSFPTSVAWSGTITTPAGGQSLWAIDGTYVQSINQTTWSAPYLTQGFPTTIQSDNYVLNTSGWQIQRDTGNAYFNNGSFRGDIITNGDAVFKGDNPTSTTIPVYDSLYYVDYSALGDGTTTASLGNVRAGVLGTAVSTGSIINVGVIGYGTTPSGVVGGTGIGVVGSSNNIGGYFATYLSTGVGLVATASSTTGIAFQINQGKFNWGGYSIAQPSGSTTLFLRNDGQWATPASTGGVTSLATTSTSSGLTLSASASTGAITVTLAGTPALATLASDSNALGGYAPSSWTRIFPTNSGTANAAGSGLNLLGSGSTGIAGAYVGTSGSGNTVTWTVQATSPSDVRLKEEIADTDLGLDFVKKLRPVSYKLKADPKHQKGYGFIADEVEQVIGLDSSLVYFEENWQVGEEKGFKTIHYPSYIAVLTKAIQELSAQVEELKKQIPKS